MFFPPTDQIDMSQQPPPVPPNKPRSQKEATMAVQASPANIELVVSVVACTPEVAERYLRVVPSLYSTLPGEGRS